MCTEKQGTDDRSMGRRGGFRRAATRTEEELKRKLDVPPHPDPQLPPKQPAPQAVAPHPQQPWRPAGSCCICCVATDVTTVG